MVAMNLSQQSRIGLTVDEILVISGQLQANQHYSSGSTHQQLSDQSRLLANIIESQSQIQDLIRHQSISPTRSMYTSIKDVSPTSIVRVRAYTSRYQHLPCFDSCKCSCHNVQSFQSPDLLQSVVGKLFVGYYGSALRVQQCTEISCQARRAIQGYVHYCFPHWFIARAFTITLRSVSETLSVSITVRKVVSSGAEIFHFVGSDDVDGLQRLFGKGLASPNDTYHDGWTALNQAISQRNYQVTKFLIEAGADPQLELFCERNSAFENAWNRIFTACEDPSVTQTLRDLFPDKDNHLEERQFSLLHKIVLGISLRDLQEELRTCGDPNQQDKLGYTALCWAAQRGDTKAVSLLLKASANPNIAQYRGISPLFYAVTLPDLTCATLLLEAGADSTAVDNDGYNALFYVASFQNSRKAIQLLVAAGTNPNTANCAGCTPFFYTCYQNHAISAQALLDYGAEINVLDKEGDSALIQSIFSHADDVTQLLLSRGAAYSSRCSLGNSILHLTAQFGGYSTVLILLAAELQSVDPDATNREEKTPLQLAEMRKTNEDGFLEKFQELLTSIRARNNSLDKSQENGSDSLDNESRSTSSESAYLPSYWNWLAWIGLVTWLPTPRNLRHPRNPATPGFELLWLKWVIGLCLATLLTVFLDYKLVWQILNPGTFDEV